MPPSSVQDPASSTLRPTDLHCLLKHSLQQRTLAWLGGHVESDTGLEGPTQVRAESQSMAAKIASLGRMTPMLATVFNSVK